MHEIPDDIKRWTAKRRQALFLQLVRGETTPAKTKVPLIRSWTFWKRPSEKS